MKTDTVMRNERETKALFFFREFQRVVVHRAAYMLLILVLVRQLRTDGADEINRMQIGRVLGHRGPGICWNRKDCQDHALSETWVTEIE